MQFYGKGTGAVVSGVPQIGLYFESWGVVLIDKLRRDLLEQSSSCSEMPLSVRTKDTGREFFLMESSACHMPHHHCSLETFSGGEKKTKHNNKPSQMESIIKMH